MTSNRATLFKAICERAPDSLRAAGAGLALAFEQGKSSQWAQLLPAGPAIDGRDGRAWRLDNPQIILDAFAANRGPLPVDYEHGMHLPAPTGQAIPAAGWIEELEIREGAIWGRIEWTERAANMIAAREYRFLSPVFFYDAALNIVSLDAVALVNKPNLVMTALNSQGEINMLKNVAIALGLPEIATEAEIIAAINKGKSDLTAALNSAATPSLDKFVPRSDYDAALNRATAAETQLANEAKAKRDAETAREIDDAIKAGKIAPASRDFYVATCAQGDGLERFRAHVASLPSVFTPVLDGKQPAADQKTALNAEEKTVAMAMGISEAEFLKTKGGAAA